MRTIIFPVSVLLLIGLGSCKKALESTRYHFPIIELNHCSDTILNGHRVQICLDSVADSRCPISAECIWEGEATVNLSIQAGAQSQVFKMATLNAIPPFRNDTTIMGYRIRLLSLLPYHGDNSSPYRVELSIAR